MENKSLNIAIVDDNRRDSEKLGRAVNKYLFENYTKTFQLETFNDGEEILKTFESEKFQIIFMDIIMNNLTGIDTAKKIRELDNKVLIIFTTTSKEFVFDAFPLHSFDYILKPYEPERLAYILSEAIKILESHETYINIRVSNNSAGDMRGTKFTFTYGNCAINFLPFEDLRKYILEDSSIEPVKNNNTIKSAYTEQPDGMPRRNGEFVEEYKKVRGNPVINNRLSTDLGSLVDDSGNKVLNEGGDGNFRRWFDRSDLGNVNNNDYRDYIRHDSSVAVDDHYKTTVVNNFALGSVAQKNKELTAMDDALRRIVTGISASTGIPTNGVADALNVGFLKSVFNEQDLAAPIAKDLGNVTNSKVVSVDTMEYIGKVVGQEEPQPNTITDLGSVDNESYDTGRTPRLGNVNKKGGN